MRPAATTCNPKCHSSPEIPPWVLSSSLRAGSEEGVTVPRTEGVTGPTPHPVPGLTGPPPPPVALVHGSPQGALHDHGHLAPPPQPHPRPVGKGPAAHPSGVFLRGPPSAVSSPHARSTSRRLPSKGRPECVSTSVKVSLSALPDVGAARCVATDHSTPGHCPCRTRIFRFCVTALLRLN